MNYWLFGTVAVVIAVAAKILRGAIADDKDRKQTAKSKARNS